jgi:hypothetical protein
MNLTSDARNRIWVYDAGKRALVGFDPNGAPLDEVSVRGRGLMQRVAWMADGDGVFERTRGDTVFLLRARGADTADVARMVRAAARPVDRTACGLLGDTRRPVFSAEFHWAASPAMVAFVDDAEFKVTLIRGSRPPEVLRRDATPTRATNELATRALGGGDSTFVNGRGWCTTPTSLILEGAGVAARIPAYSRVLIDAESRVWVLRFPVPGAAPEADVYSPTRGFLGTVSLGGRNPVAFLTDGRMASIEHDADAVPVVVVYDVKWPR